MVILLIKHGLQSKLHTWYLSTQVINFSWSMLPDLKLAMSCTEEARSLAKVTRISFSTSVSHSLILGCWAMETGEKNIT